MKNTIKSLMITVLCAFVLTGAVRAASLEELFAISPESFYAQDSRVENTEVDSSNETSSTSQEAEYSCESCGKDFYSKEDAWQHKKCLQEGKRHQSDRYDQSIRYQCRLCNLKFSKIRDLVKHVKSMHEGTRYQAILCDKSFIRKRLLSGSEVAH